MKKLVSSILAAAITCSSIATVSSDIYSSGSSFIMAYAADTYFEGANPVISRGVPAYSGKSDSASSGNDEHYFTSWSSSSGDYLAYDLSGVPQAQREKVLAAHRAGIRKVLLPADNEPDIEEIPENVRKQMEFVLLKRLEDVLRQVLVTEPGGMTKAEAESKEK